MGKFDERAVWERISLSVSNSDSSQQEHQLSPNCHYSPSKSSEIARSQMKLKFALSHWLTRGSVDFEWFSGMC